MGLAPQRWIWEGFGGLSLFLFLFVICSLHPALAKCCRGRSHPSAAVDLGLERCCFASL